MEILQDHGIAVHDRESAERDPDPLPDFGADRDFVGQSGWVAPGWKFGVSGSF